MTKRCPMVKIFDGDKTLWQCVHDEGHDESHLLSSHSDVEYVTFRVHNGRIDVDE